MIDGPIDDELEKALEPDPKETEKVETEKVEDKPVETETETESDEEVGHLKKIIGDQGNEIGDLRKEVAAMQKPKAEPVPDLIEEVGVRWGKDLVADLVQVVRAELAPVKVAQGYQQLRLRYPNFDEVQGEMDEILSKSPALANAAKADPAALDLVYQVAVSKKGEEVSEDDVQKADARSQKVAEQKGKSFVERPVQKKAESKGPTEEENKAGLLGDIMEQTPDGRTRPKGL